MFTKLAVPQLKDLFIWYPSFSEVNLSEICIDQKVYGLQAITFAMRQTFVTHDVVIQI